MVGATRSGKSVLERCICYINRHVIDYVVAFSNTGTDEGNLDWIPPRYKHVAWGEKVSIDVQGKRTTAMKGDIVVLALMKEQLKFPREVRPLACVIVDDDMTGFSSHVLLRLCSQAWHLNVLVILCTQQVNRLWAPIRLQAYGVALFYLGTEQELKAAYQSYGQGFWNWLAFKDFLQSKLQEGDNKFLWKNMRKAGPWRCFMAPHPRTIPKFVISWEGDGTGAVSGGHGGGGEERGDAEENAKEEGERYDDPKGQSEGKRKRDYGKEGEESRAVDRPYARSEGGVRGLLRWFGRKT